MSKTEFFKLVRKHITVVREQGSTPPLDVDKLSLEEDRYICDLCKQPLTISRFTQCGLCGRWICKEECWDPGHSTCINCAGVIKLVKESFLVSGAVEDENVLDTLKKRVMEKFATVEDALSSRSGGEQKPSSEQDEP